MSSIRGRLLFWQIGALLLTGLLISLLTYALAWNAFNHLRDDSLEQIAYSILRHGVISDQGDGSDNDDHGQFVSQIWDDKGELVFMSTSAGGPPPQTAGANSIQWNGEEWHTYTLRSGGLTIQVGNPATLRAESFVRVARWLLLPVGLLVAVLGGLIWVAVGRALAPLEGVRGEIGRRDIAALHGLNVDGLPEEVVPLVEALNDLLARLDASVEAQRRFVADAAHELRTPLTAIRLHAQIAAAQAGQSAEGRLALQQLTEGVDRATRLVEQLLNMARLAPELRRAGFAPLRLDLLVKRLVADFSAMADARRIDLGVETCAPTTVVGDAEGLRAMFGNLLDNALRYTPAGGRVDVSIEGDGDDALVSVADNGPGIPPVERERVFERFHRLAGAEIPGSGLGLAIVRQVAELHGGRVHLDASTAGGLRARIRLPSAHPAGGGPR